MHLEGFRDFGPQHERVMTPAEYLRLPESERSKIVRVEAIPPRFGKSTFGAIRVVFRGYPMKPLYGHRRR